MDNENDPNILLWSTIEINVGIICACLPSLRHPVTQLSPRLFAHRQKTGDGSEIRSHTSITVETKYSGSDPHSMDFRGGETPQSRVSNVIDFSYFGIGETEDDQDRDTEISTISSNLPTPDTPTSLLFDIESQDPFDTISNTPPHDKNKPLPLPPSPVLSVPAPVARPAGPRSLLNSSKVFTMRSHKIRYEPRTILPLACIPESQSPAASPRRGSPPTGRKEGSISLCKSSPVAPVTDHDEERNHSHDRARRTTAPKVPAYLDPNADTSGSGGSTSYGNIAPWDACPCPGSKTYSYEILGGPRALDRDGTRSLSWRQKARRDKERYERARRTAEERREHERRSRPNGPREMG